MNCIQESGLLKGLLWGAASLFGAGGDLPLWPHHQGPVYLVCTDPFSAQAHHGPPTPIPASPGARCGSLSSEGRERGSALFFWPCALGRAKHLTPLGLPLSNYKMEISLLLGFPELEGG